MNVVCWNVRGAACTKFKTNMLDMISTHHIDMLFICEPRISGQRALKVIQTLGFKCFEVVDTIGFSGGLWLLWNDSKVTVEIVGTYDQSISACVSWPGQSPWMFTAIYASPSRVKREKLWEYLTFVAESHDLPWLLVGDFNDILSVDEKLGGASSGRSKGFKDWVDRHEMLDLGFTGPKFTWTNKRVLERLDRAISNVKWRRLFPDANVRHLPRTKSDHSPIKICLQSCFKANPLKRPFRFEAMWLKHESFDDFITETWDNSTGSAMEKTLKLVEPLKT
ncbi:hypothetical protein CerSpe_217180 [Prunus speciosa]